MAKKSTSPDFELIGPPDALLGLVAEVAAAANPAKGQAKSARAGSRPAPGGEQRLSEGVREALARQERVIPLPGDGSVRVGLVATTLPSDERASRGLRFMHRKTAPGTPRLARLQVEPLTPPGEYWATFDFCGVEKTGRLIVEPFQRASVRPSEVALSGAPGEKVRRRLYLSNDGNIPLSLGALGTMVTEEDDQVCLSLQRGLAASGEGAIAFLDAFFASLGERRTGVIKVGLSGAGVRLAPGECRAVEAVFQLPANVRPGRRYKAILGGGLVSLSASISTLAREGHAPEHEQTKAAS